MKRAVLLLLGLLLAAGCGGDDGGPGPQVASCEVEIQDPTHPPDIQPLDRDARPRIEFVTSHGSFTVEIDASKSPCNGDSMVDLAKRGFFDGTRFHRIVPEFIIQGGDPTGTGNGGSGYTTIDPPPPNTQYTKGVVAMAKSRFEQPGTGGSQFFIVTRDRAELQPDYAVVGTVVEGMDVVDKIGKLGNPQTEAPTERITIESTSVSGG
ncbi:MAG TPA: peptidylprolyl isomerase [Gaiellaceae bacterium]|jgi:cyclophilin family peptidyl-prolyl cis-trans isomerase